MISENLKPIFSKTELDTMDKLLNVFQKLLREKHELQQVCLEVYRGIRKSNKMSLVEFHWESELERVLFEPAIFLNCNQDFLKDFTEEE